MAEPSRVIHIRNVGHEISEVTKSLPPFFFYPCSAKFLVSPDSILFAGSKFELFGRLVACAERSAPGGAALWHGRQARHAARQEPGTRIRFASFSCY
jgi:hypothetical protein